MVKWFWGKERDYIVEEVEGSSETLPENQCITGLKDFAWKYIKLLTLDELQQNKKMLLAVLQPHDRWYIYTEWECQEERFVWYYTRSYSNLGSTASQWGESYHSVIHEITNEQLSFKESGKRLAQKMLSILKELATDEANSLRNYPQIA